MKLVKLLTVPAVLLCSAVLAVSASAHALTNATVSVACQTQTGTIGVTLGGQIERDNAARDVVLDLFARGKTALADRLDEITFELPAFSSTGSNAFGPKTLSFKPIGADVSGLVVEVVKVTDTSGNKSDLAIQITGPPAVEIDLTPDHQVATEIGHTDRCAPAQQQPPTGGGSGGSGGGSQPPANTTQTLAQTGGLDLRFPLIGLALLVAGAALLVVSATRRRSASER